MSQNPNQPLSSSSSGSTYATTSTTTGTSGIIGVLCTCSYAPGNCPVHGSGSTTTYIPSNYTFDPSTLGYFSPRVTSGRQVILLPGYEGPEITYSNQEVTCSKCKQTKPISQIALSYGYLKIARHICSECYAKQLDKQNGLDTNPELESALFEK